MLSAAAPLPFPEPTACFSLVADADPGIMPRVMELFAKRGLVPTHFYSRLRGRELSIDVQVRGMDATLATYIAACLRQIPLVETVLISEKLAAD